MVGTAPFAIAIGAVATAALLLYAAWEAWGRRAGETVQGFAGLLNRAGIATPPEELALSVLGGAAILWVAAVLLMHLPFLVSMLLLAVLLGGALLGAYAWIQQRYHARLNAFIQQLELAMRLMGSGLRVGLAFRQALTLTLEELPEPARHEFTRVVGQTNLGVSVYDALDELAQRMPSGETLMMARAVRIQSQTGGDLAKVLEQLAATIKDRRRLYRKARAITAEGRMSAVVLCAIPLALGAFIVLTQPAMGHALLFTGPGHVVIAIVAALELLGILSIHVILRDVT